MIRRGIEPASSRRNRVASVHAAPRWLTVRRAGLSAAAVLLPIHTPMHGQSRSDCPTPEATVGALEQPMAAVRYLADDALEGRLSGSPGEFCAAQYIAGEFSRIGLRASDDGDATRFLQPVELRSAMNAHAPTGSGMNVVGFLPGSDPDLSSEAIVLGAHHDHLGRGEVFGSLAGPEDVGDDIHNGADDNASGVAALLAVAERLSTAPPARSVVFVTFSGEEFGLLGSARYVRDPVVPVESTVAMVNLDMVGRLHGAPLIVNGTGTAEEWDEILDRLEIQTGITLARSEDGFGPSDHSSFYARDVPVLHFFTNVHAEYHRPGDHWELIDQEGLGSVISVVESVIREVGDRRTRLAHVAGAGTPLADRSGGYGAYLGTVPDFTPVDFGVRLSGVSGGSPAEEIGLEAGDVLIRLGSFEIADLYALTDALRALEPGSQVDVVFVRGGEEITHTVRLGSRGP